MSQGDTDASNMLTISSMRTTASHTIGIPQLTELLRAVPLDATVARYREAVVDDNILGRPTYRGRERTFRHLRELYVLDPSRREFAGLRQLWEVDPAARPLIGGILAFTRDSIFRASHEAIRQSSPGDIVTSNDLTGAVTAVFGSDFSESTLAKAGRNTGASWAQAGHLVGRSRKVRQRLNASPAAITFAAYLGYLSGNRGLAVLDAPWAALLDLPVGGALDALRSAHTQGLIDLLVAGNVVDVSFPVLVRSR